MKIILPLFGLVAILISACASSSKSITRVNANFSDATSGVGTTNRSGIEEASMSVNGVNINYLKTGRADGPLLIFLHGFPEFSLSWENYLLDENLRNRFSMIAIDMRGFGKSMAPQSVADYSVRKLARDVFTVARQLGHKKFSLVGHDWGGIIAYSTASYYPRAVRKLLIMSAPHPKQFCRIYSDSEYQQYTMSHYIRGIRKETNKDSEAFANFSAQTYTANNAQLLQAVTFQLNDPAFFDERIKLAYMSQWLGDPASSDPSRIDKQLNLYRAGEFFPKDQAQCALVERYQVRAPTTIIWGMKDKWLSAENLIGLSKYVNVREVIEDKNADHWTNHKSFNKAVEVLMTF